MVSNPLDIWYVCCVFSLPVVFIGGPDIGDVLEGVAILSGNGGWLGNGFFLQDINRATKARSVNKNNMKRDHLGYMYIQGTSWQKKIRQWGVD